MSERKCCDCCWWETEAELEFTELDEGECHRYPPNVPCIRKINDFGIATPEVTKGSMITTYPITYAFEWCGEFLGKENTRHEPNCDGCDVYERDLQGWCENCARAYPDLYRVKED